MGLAAAAGGLFAGALIERRCFERRRAANVATHGRGLGHAHRLAIQEISDREFQVFARSVRPMLANEILIVDPAVVANHAIGVEHEQFGSPLGPKLVGYRVARVFEQRKR